MPVEGAASKSAEELLKPYLDAVLSLTRTENETESLKPLYTLFYIENPPTTSSTPVSLAEDPSPSSSSERIIHTPSLSAAHHITEVADLAATLAEEVFWKALGVMKGLAKTPRHEDAGEGGEGVLEGMWPPLSVDAVEDDVW